MRSALWPVTRPLTCDELWRIREASAERLEIIDGELFATPPSTLTHQRILGDLSFQFHRIVGKGQLAQVFFAMLDVRLAPDTVVLPDVMIILRDRMRIIMEEWGIDGAPSLLAEITSGAYTDYRDRGIKREVYALHGVPEYWLVEPEKRLITVHSDPREDQYQSITVATDLAVSATIPGLSIDLKTLFASVPDF